MFSFLVHVFFPCLGFFHVFHVFMCINFSDDIGNSMNFVQWFLTWNAAQHLYLHVNRHVFPLLLSLTTFFWIGWSNQKKVTEIQSASDFSVSTTLRDLQIHSIVPVRQSRSFEGAKKTGKDGP